MDKHSYHSGADEDLFDPSWCSILFGTSFTWESHSTSVEDGHALLA